MATEKSDIVNKKSVWQHVLPDFTITDTILTAPEKYHCPQEKIDFLKAIFKEEGVFQIDAIIPKKQVQKLERGIRTLRQKGIHQVFAFVYDEYWLALKQLMPVIHAIFGPEAMIMPDIWAWMVDKGAKHSGWPIHRDLGNLQLTSQGFPKMITLWIPLVDVDTYNSCMVVVPLNLDDNYPYNLSNYSFKPENCRALPAPAGSAIFWSANALHWGSRSTSQAKTERISYAFYIQSEGEPLNGPVINLDKPFPFETRLRYIATQILDYSRDTFAQFMYDWAKEIRFDPKESDPSMY